MLIPETINLLYVEDDESNAQLILELLERTKDITFNVVHKCTLEEGLKYLTKECTKVDECEVDVILLDLILPNSEGVDTYKSIIKTCDFIPVVIISGHEDMASECVKLGAQDYLIKSRINAGVVERVLKYAVERKKLENSKLESEKKYRNLVGATKASIFEINFITEKFVYVNDVMCKLLGWSKEELLNMGPDDVLTKSSMIKFVERQEALKHGDFIDNVTEYEAYTKDGSIVWGLVTTEFIQDENDNVVSGTAVSIDITSQKLAEKALKEKEDTVFNELEKRIHIWKDEIKEGIVFRQSEIKAISMNIQQVIATNGVEV